MQQAIWWQQASKQSVHEKKKGATKMVFGIVAMTGQN